MGLWKYHRPYLHDTDYLLDMETGGGGISFIFATNPKQTAAIESLCSNIKLCEERLLPLG